MQKHLINRILTYALAVTVMGMLLGFFIGIPDMLLAAVKIPEDLTLTETGDQPPVVFSHKKHAEEQGLKCTECHPKIFQMKAGKITMAAMEEGKFCGTCHNGEKAFGVKAEDSCAKCHVKQ